MIISPRVAFRPKPSRAKAVTSLFNGVEYINRALQVLFDSVDLLLFIGTPLEPAVVGNTRFDGCFSHLISRASSRCQFPSLETPKTTISS